MAYLIDTNVLLRFVQHSEPQHPEVRAALIKLRKQGELLCLTPQILVEFWNVCTRPASSRGGFGLSPNTTAGHLRWLERNFQLLPDNDKIHDEWKRLVELHEVRGVQVHDARLAAVMLTHGVSHILTFNTKDFERYTTLTAVNPVTTVSQAGTN
jgi:predicted nucleic acid-binding protein